MRWVSHDLGSDLDHLELIAISDIHPGSPQFDLDAFRKWIRWLQAAPNRFAILNGDLIDAATRNSKGDPYSATMSPGEEAKWICAELEPVKDRLLCCNTGNHEERIYRQDGVDMSELIADKLGIPYSGEGTLLKVAFGKRKSTPTDHKHGPIIYAVYATHGSTASRRPGGKANRLEELGQIVVADVYIVGHTHQPICFANEIMLPDVRTNKISSMTRYFVNSGAFMRYGGYGERHGYTPSPPGAVPIVRLSGREKAVQVVL